MRLARFVVCLGVSVLWAANVSAQTATVSGRVIGADTSEGVTNALVELMGRNVVLTTPQGLFRFDGVPVGEYELRVSALGYQSSVRVVDLGGEVELTIVLDIAPLALDSVLVDARLIDFDGRVRDPTRNAAVMDASVITDWGHADQTDQRGHFDIDDVLQGSELRIRVYAFGYLPADTTLIADDEGRYDILLARDTLVERLIAEQTTRIMDRAGERMYEFQPAFDRDALARFSPALTLAQILETRYTPYVLRNVYCVVLDERHLLDETAEAHVLQNLFAQEIERMEILEFGTESLFPPVSGRLFMLRIYTRGFFQELIAENRPLRPAAIHMFTDICS